jgi:hypothetical protein
MNQYIKLLAALLALTASAISTAQELHTFSNGEVADAEKINENFQYLLNSGGGCSATQDGSSVVITCADGSSGVLAGAGTVVVYPEGQLGTSIDVGIFPQGEFVLMDANDQILGPSKDPDGPEYFLAIDYGQYYASLINDDTSSIVKLQIRDSVYVQIGYISDDCTGQPLALWNRNYLLYEPNIGFAVAGVSVGEQLIKSRLGYLISPSEFEVSGCRTESDIREAYLLQPYTPSSEILNAAYPVRLEQLP